MLKKHWFTVVFWVAMVVMIVYIVTVSQGLLHGTPEPLPELRIEVTFNG